MTVTKRQCEKNERYVPKKRKKRRLINSVLSIEDKKVKWNSKNI